MKKLKTAFKGIDNILNSNQGEGKLVVLSTRPGMGKTTLMLDILLDMAKQNREKFLFVSLENSEDKIKSMISLKGKTLNDFEENVSIVYNISENIEHALLNYKDYAVIFLDYIALIKGFTASKQTEILKNLKNFCREYAVHIICASNLKRPPLQRKSRLPMLIDVGETAGENADAVLALYRPTYFESAEPVASLMVLKGDTEKGTAIPLFYNGETRSYNYDPRRE